MTSQKYSYSPLLVLLAAIVAVYFAPVPSVRAQQQMIRGGFQPSFSAGLRAFSQGDNELAGKHFLRLAHDGDPRAQYYLAYLMDIGEGVGRDPYGAISWYRKSAEQDYLPAQSYLGYAYSSGKGVQKNDAEAFKWYTIAARRGDAIAQNNLATMLRLGRGYQKDEALAAQWYTQAAMQNNVRAQYNLATMYLRGTGVQQNYPEALRWYEYAARQGDVYAQMALAYMYRRGMGVQQDYMKAVQWYMLAADQGNGDARYNLARIYESEIPGLDKTAEDAAVWYFRAASENGHPGAQYRLGKMYAEGKGGVKKDDREAIAWLRKSADQGYVPAFVPLAKYYEKFGTGIPARLNSAINLYQKAAECGSPEGQMELGRIYFEGLGNFRANHIKAYQWFALAAMNMPSGEMKNGAIIARVRVAANLTEEQLFEGKKQVTSWKPKPECGTKK